MREHCPRYNTVVGKNYQIFHNPLWKTLLPIMSTIQIQYKIYWNFCFKAYKAYHIIQLTIQQTQYPALYEIQQASCALQVKDQCTNQQYLCILSPISNCVRYNSAIFKRQTSVYALYPQQMVFSKLRHAICTQALNQTIKVGCTRCVDSRSSSSTFKLSRCCFYIFISKKKSDSITVNYGRHCFR